MLPEHDFSNGFLPNYILFYIEFNCKIIMLVVMIASLLAVMSITAEFDIFCHKCSFATEPKFKVFEEIFVLEFDHFSVTR